MNNQVEQMRNFLEGYCKNKDYCTNCIIHKLNEEHTCGNGFCYSKDSTNIVSEKEVIENYNILVKEEKAPPITVDQVWEAVEKKDKEEVNHPKRYKGECSLECIEVMRLAYGLYSVKNFCLCNAFKYLWRYESKNGKEDVQKAKWYLDYYANNTSKEDLENDIEYQELLSLYKEVEKRVS